MYIIAKQKASYAYGRCMNKYHMNRRCISGYGARSYCKYIHDIHRHGISGHGTMNHGGSGT